MRPDAMTDEIPPVAVGGVGGSGTRLVAGILQLLGAHIGDDLNIARDNLWFTLLFKRIEILECSDAEFDLLVSALMSGLRGGQPLSAQMKAHLLTLSSVSRPMHDRSSLRERVESLVHAASRPRFDGWCGWKEPNTHVVIERLWQRLPSLRYVHVFRHALDVAHGRNQNQVGLWAGHNLPVGARATPSQSLTYWCRVHQRMEALHSTNPRRIYLLNYDALCNDPEQHLAPLVEFLGLPGREMPDVRSMIARPRAPAPWAPLESFPPAQLAYVRSLGYDTSPQTTSPE